MNSKGFTLIELIATIVILSIVILLAVPSVGNIANIVKKNSRNNIIKEIEISASKYAFDTNETVVFVDKLIQEGYLKGDQNGEVIDPLNKEKMNCYIVTMRKNGNSYDALFDDNNYIKNGSCDESKLNDRLEKISIDVLVDGVRKTTDDWVKGKVSLRVYSNNIIINCEQDTCLWTSTTGKNVYGSEIIIDSIEGILDTKYIFELIQDEKRYTSSVNLRIDNEPPVIYEDEIVITNKFINTNYKDVKIMASDNLGSGINGYYLKINNGEDDCSKISEDLYQKENNFKIFQNGNYLMCVKDKVGNVSEYKGLNIYTIS